MTLPSLSRSPRTRRISRLFAQIARILPPLLILLSLFALTARPTWAQSGGGLTVEIIAGPNLVVDSNVTSSSSYAPSVATVIGKFCNTGSAPLEGVQGFIGNWDGAASTPGIYPARNSSDAGFINQHGFLANTGLYQLTHIGGSAGLRDASRAMGTIPAGECRVQYWHFTYPRRGNPNNTGAPVWGASNNPNDDLWLEFDVWAYASGSSAATATHATNKITMRNEISAMANKIEPNDGMWFNTKDTQIYPGDVITSNGVNYDLGLVNQGFDNDGDFAYDYNAWLQPVGDPNFDPSCFRLIRTIGDLYVKRSGGLPDLVIPFRDTLYFTDLPADNTGVRGNVRYSFLALDGPCTTALSPYQEVASGADNEKFNSDFGASVPPVVSLQPQVTINKSASPTLVPLPLPQNITYQVPLANTGSVPAGQPLYSTPLVISDTLPAGLQFVSASLEGWSIAPSYLYSSDGQTWTSTASSAVRYVQVWLNEQLRSGFTNTLTVVATVPAGYSGNPLLENNACASYGVQRSFACASAVSIVPGGNALGDLVWRDNDGDGLQDAGEPGLPNIGVKLYWDRVGNGVLDASDPLVAATSSGATGAYAFTGLANGSYLVQVDNADADLPAGFNVTSKALYAVPGLGATTPSPFSSADFGFGPALRVDKMQQTANPALEGENVTYRIDLTNTRPGSGTGPRSACTYTTWASAVDATRPSSGNKAFTEPQRAYTPPGPDELYALAPFLNADESLSVTGFSQGVQAGTIMTVEMLLPMQKEFIFGSDEQLQVNLFAGTTSAFTQLYNAAGLPDGLLVVNVSSARTWSWADFNGNLMAIQLVTKKSGNFEGRLKWDAAGFRIQTNQRCGNASDTLSVVPFTDAYDPARLQFVSAVPVPDSQASGSLTWDNLGPLYPGQTRSVSVLFKTLPFPGTVELTTDNTASVSGALFSDGRPANNASDSVTTRLKPAGSMSGMIWNDLNADGLYGAGEPLFSGVTVRLEVGSKGELVRTAVTDLNGQYLFTSIPDGTYRVTVDTASLPGLTFTQTHDPDITGRCSGAQCDNTTNQKTIASPNYDYPGLDFGYTVPNAVSGSVWQDHDNDRVRDTGEDGITNVTVRLVCGGTTVQTRQTLADGSYAFEDVANQTSACSVVVDATTLPIGGTWTQTVDPDGTLDSTAATPLITGGRVFGPYAFAYYRGGSLSIGDTLYTDWDGDGVQDPGEEGLPNVTVRLYEDSNADGAVDPAADALIASSATDPSGGYTFSGLAGSIGGVSYVVVVDRGDLDLPAAYLQTGDPDQPGALCTACDSRGRATLTTASLNTVDFGYRPAGFGSIGDFVWRDLDHDMKQDAGETGIPNITVRLYEDGGTLGAFDPATDALIATTATNASGLYAFGSLPAGNYLVDVDASDNDLPVDASGVRYWLSTANDPQAVTLAAGQAYTGADFGFTPGGVIGDFIWDDTNGNGTPDPGETGAANISVRLYNDVNANGVYDAGDTTVGDRTTDAGGYYAFSGLPAGAYVVVVNTSRPITGDPDVTPPCGACDNQSGVTITTGQVDRTRDFGLGVSGPIGDTLWIDSDADGLRDAGEAGVRGATVSLYRDTNGNGSYDAGVDTQAATTTTGFDGLYAFAGAGDGTFFVVPGALPSGLAGSFEPDGEVNGWVKVVVGGEVVTQIGDTACTACAMNADFGYRWSGAYTISGTVFFDAGNDGGLYASGTDTPYAGIPVYLWRGSELVAAVMSGADGLYTFSGLPAGDYAVSVNTGSTLLAGMTLNTPAANPYYTPVTITGANAANNDFGFYASLDFGDLPATYALTRLGNEGPRHLLSAVRLGGSITAEPDGVEIPSASWDTGDDGISRTPGVNWSATPGGASIDVTVTGGGGYLSGWVDWNHDNDFADPDEQVLLDQQVGEGAQTLTFDVPASVTFGASFNLRFRLYPASTGGIALPYGPAAGGEVEDYQWAYSPTAIRLSTLSAASPRSAALPVAVLALGLLAAAGAAWLSRR